jgi:hypothetical protein
MNNRTEKGVLHAESQRLQRIKSCLRTFPGIEGINGSAPPIVPTPVAPIRCRVITVTGAWPKRDIDNVQVRDEASYETAEMRAEVKT